MTPTPGRAAATMLVVALLACPALAQASAPAAPADAVARGVAFLVSRQDADGGWSGHVGITAVVLLALRAAGAPEAVVTRGRAYVERWARPDGGIYQEDVRHYTTAVAVLALTATGDARHRPLVAGARDYLLGLQAREDTGVPPTDPRYGGTLVGDGKVNLDASFFTARALAVAGLPRDHAFWARAVRFASRCQNLAAANDQPWAGTDGGFVFSPGFSFAGGTTSYGTMTYAGLSTYLDAGLPVRDPRVAAALDWLRRRFTAEENPGLGRQTLYHSYLYTAQTLSRPELGDGSGGTPKGWRRALTRAIMSRQRVDGSWANEDPRWWESNPVLATAFAVRALTITTTTAKEKP